MQNRRSILAAFLALVSLAGPTFGQGKREKSPLPATATWELRPLERLFRVVKTEYDEGRQVVRWTVATREGYRTLDFVRLLDRERFTFTFFDEDMRELATIQLRSRDFKGIPSARTMNEGTRLETDLELPKSMPKVKKVVLSRGKG
ncbi:MAG TPA: hypothetical protein VFE78_23300 [Gemmataceae bacterium]|jgi:hypothetical protein|nr:hypothetical protein [Gemmataceae bacterium]